MGADAATRTAMRERRRRDRAARRRLLSCSSWSASASRYSSTNVGCMVAPLTRLVALLMVGACRAGRNTCYLNRLRATRVFIGLCQDGGMDSEDLRLASRGREYTTGYTSISSHVSVPAEVPGLR